MKRSGFVRHFFSALLLAATLLASLHHHNDLKTHNDCPICVLQSNFAGADMPAAFSLEPVETLFVPIASHFISLRLSNRPESVLARSPPLS